MEISTAAFRAASSSSTCGTEMTTESREGRVLSDDVDSEDVTVRLVLADESDEGGEIICHCGSSETGTRAARG